MSNNPHESTILENDMESNQSNKIDEEINLMYSYNYYVAAEMKSIYWITIFFFLFKSRMD